MARRWDQVFEEMVEGYDQLTTGLPCLKTESNVTVEGKTPDAVKVAQNHARIISGLVKEGQTAVSRKHKTAL